MLIDHDWNSLFHSYCNRRWQQIDYKEEQANELEALQSIYPDEYEEISSDPGEFTILVVPDEQDGDDTCKIILFFSIAAFFRINTLCTECN